MILKIYTDVHLFSPMYDGTEIRNAGECYFIGDIVDLANCDKEDIEKAKKTRANLQLRSKAWIDGNHERYSKGNNIIWAEERIGVRIMMVHGDFEAWGAKRATKYRQKKWGAGFLKRQLWTRSLKFFESLWPTKPSKKMINNLVKLAKKREADVIIAGHNHPKKRFDEHIDGVRVIVLQRGYNEVNV